MAISKIISSSISDNTVVAADVGPNAITASELADDAVDTAAIANDAVTTAKVADDAVTGAKIENNPTIAGNLSVGGTAAITGTSTFTGALTASGGIANAGTISAGTIGTSVTFPTRSDFGILESFSAGNPLMGASTSQDFSYTSGQEYCVLLEVWFTDGTYTSSEIYRISTNNTVTEVSTPTGNVTPSIPSSGTLRITTSTSRWVRYVELIRMDW